MTLATRNEILNAIDWDFDEFDVPKWGTVRIKALSAAERLALVKQFGGGSLGNDEAFAFFTRLIALSLVDANGKLLFDPENPEDVVALQTRNWGRLEHVANRIMAFNGMSGEAEKELGKN